MVGLVQLLLKSSAACSLIEDYAACLELRSEESQFIENSTDDPGVLILQVGHSGHKILISSVSLIFAIYIYINLSFQFAASNRQYWSSGSQYYTFATQI